MSRLVQPGPNQRCIHLPHLHFIRASFVLSTDTIITYLLRAVKGQPAAPGRPTPVSSGAVPRSALTAGWSLPVGQVALHRSGSGVASFGGAGRTLRGCALPYNTIEPHFGTGVNYVVLRTLLQQVPDIVAVTHHRRHSGIGV
jgi:hypothetical protein